MLKSFMQQRSAEVDEYVECFPPQVQEILENIRSMFLDMVSDGHDAMRYGIPTIIWNGNLIHFAAFKTHIGVYPAPRDAAEFKDELAGYKGGKGTVQFPLSKPIPYELIRRIAEHRIQNQPVKQRSRKKADT